MDSPISPERAAEVADALGSLTPSMPPEAPEVPAEAGAAPGSESPGTPAGEGGPLPDIAGLVAMVRQEERVRHAADTQNTVRRIQQEADQRCKLAVERFAQDLLAVVDSLERGLLAVDPAAEVLRAYRAGMELTLQQLLSVLEKFGVSALDPVGQRFDPKFHAALTLQATEAYPPDHVVQVLQKGYLLHERLLRPAGVMVSKAPVLES